MRRFPHLLRTLPAALALLGLLPQAGGAAVHVWTGAGSSTNWSEAANWSGGLPVAGGELLLDSAARPATFNDLAGGFTLLGLTLGPNAAAPTLSGNALRFQGAGAYLSMASNAGHGTVNNALVLDSTLQVSGGPSGASQLFLRGNITGPGGFTAASGLTVMSGNNSFTGLTRVESGAALGVAGSALAGSAGLQVARGGELQIVNSNVVTVLQAPLQLGGRLSSSAGDVTTVFGEVPGGSFAGAITLSDAAEIVSVGHACSKPVRFTVSGTVDRAGQALTLTTLGALGRLDTAAIQGNGSLTLRPDGGAITTGAITGTGELVAAGSGGLATVASLGGSGTVRVDYDSSFGRLTITGALSGQHDLDVRKGTLVLGSTSPLSFAGQITMSGNGTLQLGRESYLGTASPVLQFVGGGRLVLNDGLGLTRAISTTGGRGSLVLGGANNTVSGTISGDGGLNLIGGGILLTGNNSFAGGLGVLNDGTVNGAGQPNITTVRFLTDANLGAAGQGITLSGSLALPDGYDLSRPLELSGNVASLSGSGSHVISSAISGDGRLNLGGAARYVLAGTATHTGGVALAGQANGQAAELVLASDAQLGAPGGVLNIGRTSGIATLPGTLVAAAHLDIAATRSTSFQQMTVDTNGFDVVFNQPISGLGMTKAGGGTWTLNTANSNSSGDNPVRVLAGTLALGVDEALGTRSRVDIAAGAQLTLGGHALTVNTINGDAGSNLDLGSGGVLRPLFGTLDGTLSGQGQLVVGRAGFSPGAVTLNGANSFVGSVIVSQGSRLTLGHVDALGAPGNLLRLDGGALEASNRLAAPLVINAATNLQIGPGGAGFVAGGQALVIERSLSGALTLNLQGGSLPTSLGGDGGTTDVRLAARNNSFTGDLVLGDPQGFGSAVLGITADGSLGAASNRLILGKQFFDGESTRSAVGGLRAWDSLTLAATRTVLLDGLAGDTAGFIDTHGHTLVLAGSIGELQPGLGLLKTGAGTLVVNAAQGYTGLTTVEDGALGGHGVLEQVAVRGAELAPGESAGLLTIRQNLSFASGSRLTLELGGSTRGSGYDALDVGGSVDLGDGTALQLSFIGGFMATAEQQFELIQAGGGLFGQFANVADGARLMTSDGSGSFLVHYGNGQTLVLSDFQTSAVPEPGSWALMLGGVAWLAWRRRSAR